MEEKLKLDGIIEPESWEVFGESQSGVNSFTFAGNDNHGNLVEVKIYEDNIYQNVIKLACKHGKKFKFTIEEIED